MDRRSFLKRAGGFALAAGVPLFIPMDRLEFGLPSKKIIVASNPDIQVVRGEMVSVSYQKIYGRISLFLYDPQIAIQEWNGEGWVDVKGKIITSNQYRAVNLLKGYDDTVGGNTLVVRDGDGVSTPVHQSGYSHWVTVDPRTIRSDRELAFAHSLPPKMKGPSDPTSKYAIHPLTLSIERRKDLYT